MTTVCRASVRIEKESKIEKVHGINEVSERTGEGGRYGERDKGEER